MWSKTIYDRPSLEQIDTILKEVKSLWGASKKNLSTVATTTLDNSGSEAETIKSDIIKKILKHLHQTVVIQQFHPTISL